MYLVEIYVTKRKQKTLRVFVNFRVSVLDKRSVLWYARLVHKSQKD